MGPTMSVFLVPVLLVLASYRGTRLVVRDDFPPLLWMRDRLAGGWRPATEAEHKKVLSPEYLSTPVLERQPTMEHEGQLKVWIERASWSPHWLAELVTCPWCASAYVSGALVALTWAFAGLPVPLLMWPAVWAGSALLASREWA
jgi:hypothetical protein